MMNEHFASLYGKRERKKATTALSPRTQWSDRPDALFLCDYSITGTGSISFSSSYLLLLSSLFRTGQQHSVLIH
jgi:hypothetical protein